MYSPGCSPANRQENGTVAEREGLTVPDCYRESRVLIVLQGDLLRKHDVAPGKISLRPKAPSGHLRAALIELIDVHHPVGANAVAFAGARPYHLEMPIALKSRALRRR